MDTSDVEVALAVGGVGKLLGGGLRLALGSAEADSALAGEALGGSHRAAEPRGAGATSDGGGVPASGPGPTAGSTPPAGAPTKRIHHFTTAEADTNIHQDLGINASDPETFLSVNAQGVHDAGVHGRLDRSWTRNIFFTDLSPEELAERAAKDPQFLDDIGIRSQERVISVDPDELKAAGIPVHQNPTHPHVVNVVTDFLSTKFFK